MNKIQRISDPVVRTWFMGIWNRVNVYKKSCFICVVGDPGDGKSWTAGTFGEILNPEYTAKQTAYSGVLFIRLVQDSEKGQVIAYEEWGVNQNSRRFMSKTNILQNVILQTLRHRKIIVIFNVPDMSYVDKAGRKLLNYLLVCYRHQLKPTDVWIYEMKKNKVIGKEYLVHPIIQIKKEKFKLVKFSMVETPSKQWIDEYEATSTEYKKNLESSALKELQVLEHETDIDEIDLDSIAEEVVENVRGFMTKKNTISHQKIKAKYKLSIRQSKDVRAIVEMMKEGVY